MSDNVIIAGGNGDPGQLYLRDGAGEVRVCVRAAPPPSGQITVALGKETIHLDGEHGRIHVKMPSGKGTITLDGATGFSVRDQAGKVVLNFAGEANMTGKPSGLWIGTAKGDGASHAGLVVIRNIGGQDAIILDGNNGFSVRDNAGKVVLNFAGEANMTGKPAGLWVGRAKADGGGPGLFVVRDGTGNDSVVIDGAQGDIVLANADCAEEFDFDESDDAEPGAVVVLDSNGRLTPATMPYDKRVVGVISGAGSLRPGMVLDRRVGPANRRPVALVGKVHCRADGDICPIEIGDLLTSSVTRGHAMKAEPKPEAFGAVIGKALAPLSSGRDLIPILVALQ